ncbi:MAG: hypothetical protein R2830_10155 [Saprospiraceae bacterium]
MSLQNQLLTACISIFFFSMNLHAQTLGQVDGDFVIPANKDYKYSAPKTKYLAVSYNAFTSSKPDTYDFIFDTANKPYRYFTGGGNFFGYANAPVYLPDGAIVTEIKAWIYDNDATKLTRLRLERTPFGGGNIIIGTVETTDVFASTTVQELTTTVSETVDNSAYSYYLRFTSGASNTEELRLYGVRITYTVSKVD